MFDRILPVFHSDTPVKAVRAVIDRLAGQPMITALDALYAALREGLAGSPTASAARRLIDVVAPAALEWADRALAELATGTDNPVRRDMNGKRLALLADQLANACYIEALRESALLQKGGGRTGDLAEWASLHFRWLGYAHTAHALLDSRRAHIQWEVPVSLFLALVRHGVLPAEEQTTAAEPALSLAYLLLSHDAFPAVEPKEVAVVARSCRELASSLRLAADFHRDTPLVMDAEANEASRIVGWGGPGRAAPALCYGLDEPARLARLRAAGIDAEDLPPPMLPKPPTADQLERLAANWLERRGRCRNPVAVRLGSARAAFDFLRIRGLLGQKSERLPTNDPYMRQAQIEDVDESGVSMLLPGDSQPLLASGLVALNFAERGWWLAKPVRLLPEPDGRLFMTARWLGQEAEAIRLTPTTGDGQRALYLKPGPANDYQAGVLLDHAWLAAGLACRADLDEVSLTLVPGEPEQLGPALWCYRCRQVQ
ncbi:hypothetical protein FNU76_20505 [Chitinimonas arctica]|uniref:Uncharacterized protein n=1 Tax=Chitinimonas arctica TaxID=2594795 RepID=A0A516SK53_9NEIS|nr:hypothetical protein [Chitinimonas arctica]QDQ28541.1 hypothetical protein FNU76_20505 [Chitinimonas arctica]